MKKTISMFCVLVMLAGLLSGLVYAEDTATVLVKGPREVTSAWNSDVSANTTNWGGTFDPAAIAQGGSFYICYEGAQGQIKLALNGPDWYEVAPTSTRSWGDGWVSEFSYEDCVAAYGTDDFSPLGAVHAFVLEAVPMTVLGIYWGTCPPAEPDASQPEETVPHQEPALPELMGESLFSGAQAIPEAWGVGLQLFTTDFGGTLNVANIAEGCVIQVAYTGTAGKLALALQDETWTRWDKVYPSDQVTVGNKTVATFTYADLADAYGEDLATLACVNVCAEDASDLVITNVNWKAATPAPQEPALPELPGESLFVGSEAITAPWGVGVSMYTTAFGGLVDPARLLEGSSITVVYSGTAGQLALALQDDTWVRWDKVYPSGEVTAEGSTMATFTYEDLVGAYGEDLSTLACVNVCAENTSDLVILAVSWVAAPKQEPVPEETVPQESVPEESVPEQTGPQETVPETSEPAQDAPATGNETLYSGSASASGAWTLAVETHTNNSDGTFDPDRITSAGYFTVTYTGTEGAVYLAFADWDTGAWKQIDVPFRTYASGDGYVSVFSFADCRNAWGSSDFSGVDAICVGSGNAAGTTTVSKIAWKVSDGSNPGTGDRMPLTAITLAAAAALGLGVALHKRRELM